MGIFEDLDNRGSSVKEDIDINPETGEIIEDSESEEEMPTSLNDLTIVCPTAGYPNLVRSLKTFKKYAPGAKVIVVDQTPEGALTFEQQKEYTNAYAWVYRALGFSKAMNFGILMSDTKYVCCANDDVELVDVRWWDGIIEAFKKHDNVCGVNPASIKGFGGEPDHLPYKEEYTKEDYDFLISPHVLETSQTPNFRPDMVIHGIMTWFTVFDRDKLEAIKDNGCYFDERFYPGGGEDYDLNCRVFDKKMSLLGIHSSWAYHHWNATRIKSPPKLIDSLRWNSVEDKYKRKETDPKIIHNDGKERTSNWDLWGRINKEIPMPPCTKVNL